METILQGLPGVYLYLDDILITRKTEEEHLTNLSAVLQKIAAAGMRLKSEKCSFLLKEVEYLGHKISAKGLQPSTEKVQAIMEAPQPTNECHTAKVIFGHVELLWKILTQSFNLFSSFIWIA